MSITLRETRCRITSPLLSAEGKVNCQHIIYSLLPATTAGNGNGLVFPRRHITKICGHTKTRSQAQQPFDVFGVWGGYGKSCLDDRCGPSFPTSPRPACLNEDRKISPSALCSVRHCIVSCMELTHAPNVLLSRTYEY